MTLPAAINRHHTAWIHCDTCAPHPVRYTVDSDRIVCFGDQLLGGAVDGGRVTVTVHEIAGGQAVAEFIGPLRTVDADSLDPNSILDLLEHVALGRTASERAAELERHRTRRFVAVTNHA